MIYYNFYVILINATGDVVFLLFFCQSSLDPLGIRAVTFTLTRLDLKPPSLCFTKSRVKQIVDGKIIIVYLISNRR